jgi:hypothetical protein
MEIASVAASLLTAWVDGVQVDGGCYSMVQCAAGVKLALQPAAGNARLFVFKLNTTASGGLLRRVFLL